MTFESEKAMKEVAIETLPTEIRGSGLEVIPEFDYGPGRADLVFVDISEPYWKRRINRLDLTSPIKNKNHLISFLHLHGRGPITEEYYFDIGALRYRYKKNSLDWLKENGYIIDLPGDKIRTTPNLRKHVTTTIGVELKLRKWRKALQQARRGRSFAEYKFVVLDSDHIEPAVNNIDKFKEENIGLIAIDGSGECTTFYQPERGDPHNNYNQWLLNEISVSMNMS